MTLFSLLCWIVTIAIACALTAKTLYIVLISLGLILPVSLVLGFILPRGR